MKQVNEIRKLVSELSESQWHDVYLQHARGERADVVPFPPEEIQVITNGQKAEVTAKGAISILRCVMQCVIETLPEPSSAVNRRVLDYGCGWGRITRLLPFYFDVENITGVDVDERLIESTNELLPFMTHRKITSMEALPFADASFDVVFANSVFSHLSEESALFTLSELSRVLENDGVLIVSVLEKQNMENFYANQNQKAWISRILGPQEEAAARLRDNGFVWGDTGRWHEYGIAIMDDDWIAARFDAAGIKYLGTRRGEHRGTQNYKFGVKNNEQRLIR